MYVHLHKVNIVVSYVSKQLKSQECRMVHIQFLEIAFVHNIVMYVFPPYKASGNCSHEVCKTELAN